MVARILRAFFGLVPFVFLGASSCRDDSRDGCCYLGVGSYCEQEGCPASFERVFGDCHYPDVYYEEGGNRRAIGYLGSLGGYLFSYRGEVLVGVLAYNDVLETCPCVSSCGRRAVCSNIKEVGESFFAPGDTFGGCTECGGLTHCSNCPEYFAEGEEPPPCPASLGEPLP